MDFQKTVDRIVSQLVVPPDRPIPPVLVVLVGLPGAGKSTLARALAPILPAAVVESDFVRRQLFESPAHSDLENRVVHRAAQAVMERLLRQSISVVSDATNLIESHREMLYRLAAKCDARPLVVRLVAPETVVRQRLEQRQSARSPHDWSDADWSVYVRMKPTQENIGRSFISVRTDGDLTPATRKVARAVRELRDHL